MFKTYTNEDYYENGIITTPLCETDSLLFAGMLLPLIPVIVSMFIYC